MGPAPILTRPEPNPHKPFAAAARIQGRRVRDPNRLPGIGTGWAGSALRGRTPTHCEGASVAPSAHPGATGGLRQPRKRRSAASATRPARTSERDAGPGRARCVITAATKTPPRQTTRPASWRAASTQPALWSTSDDASAAATTRPSLLRSRDVGEQVEEVTRLGGVEPPRAAGRAARARRSRARSRDGAARGRARSSPSRSPTRLLDDVQRHAARGELAGRRVERRADDVAAVHLGSLEPDRPHRRVDEVPAAARRAAEQDEQAVGRLVVRRDRASAASGGRGCAARAPGGPSARQQRDGDRELQRRRGREGRPRVPRRACAGREVLDVRRRRPGKRARRGGRTSRWSRDVEPRRAEPRPSARGQAEDVVDRPAGAGVRARRRSRPGPDLARRQRRRRP